MSGRDWELLCVNVEFPDWFLLPTGEWVPEAQAELQRVRAHFVNSQEPIYIEKPHWRSDILEGIDWQIARSSITPYPRQ